MCTQADGRVPIEVAIVSLWNPDAAWCFCVRSNKSVALCRRVQLLTKTRQEYGYTFKATRKKCSLVSAHKNTMLPRWVVRVASFGSILTSTNVNGDLHQNLTQVCPGNAFVWEVPLQVQ